jgi:hypothetical protein
MDSNTPVLKAETPYELISIIKWDAISGSIIRRV